jgi:hypothetical protein
MGVGGSSSRSTPLFMHVTFVERLSGDDCTHRATHLKEATSCDTTFHAWAETTIFLSNWLEYCTRLKRSSKVNNNLWRLRFSILSLGSWLEWRWQRQSYNAQKASVSGRPVEISFSFVKGATLLSSFLTVNSSNLGFIAMAHRLMRSMG